VPCLSARDVRASTAIVKSECGRITQVNYQRSAIRGSCLSQPARTPCTARRPPPLTLVPASSAKRPGKPPATPRCPPAPRPPAHNATCGQDRAGSASPEPWGSARTPERAAAGHMHVAVQPSFEAQAHRRCQVEHRHQNPGRETNPTVAAQVAHAPRAGAQRGSQPRPAAPAAGARRRSARRAPRRPRRAPQRRRPARARPPPPRAPATT
jgi:hypothetical protein